MLLSMKWLNEYVDVSDIDVKEFCSRMTMSGSKVDSFRCESEELQNIVVGKIVEISKHPDADKLLVCKVDVAKEELIQIVTAAQNVFEGALVPVALHKSKIAGGETIKKGKLRGVVSEGMFCSVAELGVTINDFPDAQEDGILIITDSCDIGQDIKVALGLDDVIIDFEITPNRPDCLSMIGLAREVAAVFDRPMKCFDQKNLENLEIKSEVVRVSVQEPNLCKRYMAKVAKDVNIQPSPRWMRERLRSSGVRPINNIVDITNYVMLEYGQPIHAFDKDKIFGSHLVVRRAHKDEVMTLLDETDSKLNEDILVIADEKNPLAVAGLMGGKDSGVSSDTKEIVFDVADFDKECIRQASKKLAVRTEISARFEKGTDSAFMPVVLNRICQLVTQLGAAKIEPGIIDIKNNSVEKGEKTQLIKIDYDFINNVLGLKLQKEQVKEQIDAVLSKLGVEIKDSNAVVPSWRKDLIGNADLAEEVCRLYGYDKICSRQFDRAINLVAKRTPRQQFDNQVMDFMASSGYYEIKTFSFISPKSYDKINLDENNKLRDSVRIINPLGEDTSVMRTTAVSSMLEVVSKNFNNQNCCGRFFEFAKEYLKKQEKDNQEDFVGSVVEKDKLIACLYGKQQGFYDLKSDILNLFDLIGLKEYNFIMQSNNLVYHPGRCADIFVEGVQVGVVGEVHPVVAEEFQIFANVVLADLDLQKIFEQRKQDKQYSQISKFPSVVRDLALICDRELPVAVVENLIKETAEDNLEEICLMDVYTGKQIEEDKKSVCFSLKLRAFEKTLTENDIESIINKILRVLEKKDIYLRN